MPSEELPYATKTRKRPGIHETAGGVAGENRENSRRPRSTPSKIRCKKNAVTLTSKFPQGPSSDDERSRSAGSRTPLEQQLATLAHRQILFEYEKLDTQIKGAEKDRLLALAKSWRSSMPISRPRCRRARASRGSRSPAAGNDLRQEVGADGACVPDGAERARAVDRGAEASDFQRPAHGVGVLADTPRSSAHQPRPGESRLAAAFLPGSRRHGQRFRQPGRKAEPSRAARLADAAFRARRLEHQETASADFDVEDVPAIVFGATADALAMQKDPENRWLWKMPTRRLDAEQIRDAMLVVTGKLDRTVGGPSVEFKEPRRSVYLKWLRNTKEPLLDVFDIRTASPALRSATSPQLQRRRSTCSIRR